MYKHRVTYLLLVHIRIPFHYMRLLNLAPQVSLISHRQCLHYQERLTHSENYRLAYCLLYMSNNDCVLRTVMIFKFGELRLDVVPIEHCDGKRYLFYFIPVPREMYYTGTEKMDERISMKWRKNFCYIRATKKYFKCATTLVLVICTDWSRERFPHSKLLFMQVKIIMDHLKGIHYRPKF